MQNSDYSFARYIPKSRKWRLVLAVAAGAVIGLLALISVSLHARTIARAQETERKMDEAEQRTNQTLERLKQVDRENEEMKQNFEEEEELREEKGEEMERRMNQTQELLNVMKELRVEKEEEIERRMNLTLEQLYADMKHFEDMKEELREEKEEETKRAEELRAELGPNVDKFYGTISKLRTQGEFQTHVSLISH